MRAMRLQSSVVVGLFHSPVVPLIGGVLALVVIVLGMWSSPSHTVLPVSDADRDTPATRTLAASRPSAAQLPAFVAQRFPWVADLIARRAHFIAWRDAAQTGWRPHFAETTGARTNSAEVLDLFFPEYFTHPHVIDSRGLRLTVEPLDALPVRGQVIDGRMVYVGAWPHVDVLYTVSRGQSEEFLLLHSPAAFTSFVHRLRAAPDAPVLKEVDLQADGGIRVTDVHGGQVSIAPPYVIDSHGHRSSTSVSWQVEAAAQGTWNVRLEIEPAGLSYPLLIDPSWRAPWHMNQGRKLHTATLLPSGKVLVVGGHDGVTDSSSVESFDPMMGDWKGIQSLATGRSQHTATMLPSGKVLVVGGVNATDHLSSCELFDPETMQWSNTGSLADARRGHTATLLPSGEVLVTGGRRGDLITTTEIYEPQNGSWRTVAPMSTGRVEHTTIALPSGQVLVIAGYGLAGSLASIERFEPDTGAWSQVGSLLQKRSGHSATLLPSGLVLIVGGDDQAALNSVELFDPANGTSAASNPLPYGVSLHSAGLLPSGKVIVIAGRGNYFMPTTPQVFDPVAKTWTPARGDISSGRMDQSVTLLPSGQILMLGGWGNDYAPPSTNVDLINHDEGQWATSTAQLTTRTSHTSTPLPSGEILVVGGVTENYQTLAACELLDPMTLSWAPAASLAQPRRQHTATLLPGGKVLVVGGSNGVLLEACEIYDTATRTWSPTGSLSRARYGHSATLLASGEVLVVGGYGAGILPICELYEPSTGLWQTVSPLNIPRYGHESVLLHTNEVLVVGGESVGPNSSAVLLSSAELYDPDRDTWRITGGMSNPRSECAAALLPSGEVLVAGGLGTMSDNYYSLSSAEVFDPVREVWSLTGTMPKAHRQNTLNVLPSGKVMVISGYYQGLAEADVYDHLLGAWQTAGVLGYERRRHTAALLPSGKVVVIGGEYNHTTNNNVEAFSPLVDSARSPVLSNIAVGDVTVVCTGTRFTQPYAGTDGSANESPSPHPVIQLQHQDSGRLWYLDAVGEFSDARVEGQWPAGASGPCWLRVAVNGMLSTAIHVDLGKPRVVAVTANKSSILDNGDSALLTVRIARPFHLPISVDLSASGTASNPQDFTINSMHFSFPPGTTEATATITGRNTNRVSGDRSLILTVTDAGNARIIAPALSVGLTIESSNRAPSILPDVNQLPLTVGGQMSSAIPVTTLFFGKISDEDISDGKGIAITGIIGAGEWSFSVDNGANWQPIAPVNPTAALLLSEAGSTQVRYQSERGFPETASITYRAWDRTNRNEGERVDVVLVHGGNTAFSDGESTTNQPVTSQSAPIVTIAENSATWIEGTSPLQIDGGATCSDVDSLNFLGGSIMVALTPANQVGDRLSYNSALTGGIVRSGSELRTSDGILLGTLSGGENGANLSIALTAATTPSIAQTMLRGVTYENVSGNPTTTPTGTTLRDVVITVDDETGSRGTAPTKAITIQAVDQPPVIEPLIISLVPGLTVTSRLVAYDPEGAQVNCELISLASKGQCSIVHVPPLAPVITYRHTVLDGLDDHVDVRVSDGTLSTQVTVPVKITTGIAGGLRFTSAAPQVWRSGVVLSYTPTIAGATSPVFFTFNPSPHVAKTGSELGVNHYTFDPVTGTVTIPLPPVVDGDYLRFGILAVDSATGASAYQPVLLKIVVAGSG